MYFKTLSKSECCACTACEQVCSVHAITFFHDNEGFLYPVINKEKCIDCGLCERVCPVEHPNYNNNKEPEAYAAMIKDVEQRKRSSSGGMFYVLASWILKQGGKVYGATMDENHQVKHISVDKLENLYLLRGSKYVQSDLQHVFTDIKNELKAGHWCYFIGTGCQVAGLKAFLRKDYDTLLTSDLVCHGVPSQWLFNQHVKYLEEKYKGKVSDYQFRNNEAWGGCEIFNITSSKGKIKKYKFPSYDLSPYLYSFMYGMTSRFSCYNCKFACIPRQGDITLADYWGVKQFFPNMDNTKGVSLVLVNSEKGCYIFEQIKDACEIRQSTVSDGAKYNINLIKSSSKNKLRDEIYIKIRNVGYASVVLKEFRSPKYNSIKFILFLQTTPILKKIWRLVSYLRNALRK